MNTEEHVYFKISVFFLSFFFDKYPGVGSLDHMMVLFSVLFLKKLHTVLQVHQFPFPPTVHEGSLFSTPFPTFLFKRLVFHSQSLIVILSAFAPGYLSTTPRSPALCSEHASPGLCRSRAALSALLTHFASCVTCSTQPSTPVPARNLS